MKKIAVITGTRAEYGLFHPLLEAMRRERGLKLQLIATGMHLSWEFGLTYREIEQDGFDISEKVEMLLGSDTAEGITKSTGLGLIGFADTFKSLRPDMVIVLGDRFESFAAATALGVRVIEKHLTLSRSMKGPDHYASLEPEDFKRMVESIRNVEMALGDGIKRPSASEKKTVMSFEKAL